MNFSIATKPESTLLNIVAETEEYKELREDVCFTFESNQTHQDTSISMY